MGQGAQRKIDYNATAVQKGIESAAIFNVCCEEATDRARAFSAMGERSITSAQRS